MEFKHLSIFALFCMTLMGINGSQSGEDYWKSIWPNTPMPEALSDMLQAAESGSNLPIRDEENKQYWTVFFEHDLYPGNKITLGFHKNHDIQSQPFGKMVWQQPSEEIIHPLGALKSSKKETQPFGQMVWQQPSEEIIHPLEALKSSKKETQPFGQMVWQQPSEEIIHHLGALKPSKKETQPFGFWAWKKPSKEISQSFGARRTWDEKERRSINNLCRKPSAIGEDKYCALSLESMIDFAISKLGTNIKVISSSLAQNQDQYVVDEVNKIGDKAVMCHRLNFKEVVFYCHQVNATTAYMVPLVASDGTKSKALTICHHDTRGMDPNMLYEILKVKPGTVPICHFVGNKAIAWVPDRVANESVDHCTNTKQ